MICPYCNKSHSSPHHSTALMNVEAYGDNTFNFQCFHCGKVYFVSYARVVQIKGEPMANDKLTEDDLSFGYG